MKSLEKLSKELKEIISGYDTGWFLGDLANLMHAAGNNTGGDQLEKLSSPQRQLYYLGGLLMSSAEEGGNKNYYDPETWEKIVALLVQIEESYATMFFPTKNEVVDDNWAKVRKVAMPSFLDYFNQGPLNFEEQIINWVKDLYLPLDATVEKGTGLSTNDFLKFYENVDALHQRNFQGFGPKGTPRENWKDYAKVKMKNTMPAPLREMMGEDKIEEMDRTGYFMADHGIIDRFYAQELVSDNLPLEKIEKILTLLSSERAANDYLYYTALKPGNPLYDKPVVNLGGGMFQVFEVKQVIHAIETLLEKECTKTKADETIFVKAKGKLLEDRIEALFRKLLKNQYKVYKGYFVDGCEQDLLFLWKNHAFIIEAKGYNLREPMRDPDKAFVRIKDDFERCIGYGYDQCSRVESKFVKSDPLVICDDQGKVVDTIDTTSYQDNAFSIVVNLETFGQVQTNLSPLLEVKEADEISYPWAVKLDDLETFILMLLAKGKGAKDFVEFLMMRETLHEKLFCNDELQICGAFIEGKMKQELIDETDPVIMTPAFADIFDQQYRKGMGFQEEKYLQQKKSKKWMFW